MKKLEVTPTRIAIANVALLIIWAVIIAMLAYEGVFSNPLSLY